MVKRKEKWAEQKKEEERRKPDPDCPKGHKRVPEEERRKVLEKLKKCKFDMSLGTKLLLWQFYGFIRLHSRVPHNYKTLIRCLQLKKNMKMNYYRCRFVNVTH